MAKIQSVEPNIADLANGWLKSYKLDYKLEQESLNTEIDQALNDYYSKNGGVGGNRPDAKLLLQDKNLVNYPILIEYKGYKDKLVKLDVDGKVANKTAKNQPDFKNINSYAVNGAVHYANALLHYTSYTDIIAIGMTGYKNDAGKLEYEIGVYYVSKSNFGVGQKVDDFTDLSFLKKSNFDAFIEKVKQLQLSQEEIEKLREHREQEINASLVKLNNDIYNNEKGLSERDRVYLVAASIIATLGVPGKVAALEKSELKSSTEEGNRDGDIILRKIKAFLGEKNLPQEKRDLIVRTLQNTLTTDNINKVEDGESQLKRVFTKIIDDLGIYYKIGLSTDFTGKLFNEMYSWLGFSQEMVSLPIKNNGYIDFDFMESFIAELEAERVAELSAYLTVSGLDNYELSSDEENALKNYQSLKWDTYNLEKLFGKSTRGKRLKGDDRIAGTLPFVTAGEASEGISAYISNEVEVFEKNTTTIDMFGSAKYRNYIYGGDDHIAVVHTENLPKYASIFVTTAIHKSSHNGQFDYGHNFYAKDADVLYISLPVNEAGNPDYDKMAIIISAIHKLVIKDVVAYSNRKIKATKAVVK